MSDEELIALLRGLGDHASFEPHMHHTAADRIEQLKHRLFQCATDLQVYMDAFAVSEAKLDSLVPALSYEGLRTDEAEAKLTIAMVGLVQSRDELDQYSRNEYPSDHPVHERYRKRDYNANPARIALAKIKSQGDEFATLKGESHD